MSEMESSTSTMISYESYRRPIPFLLLLVIGIPSIFCSLLIIIFFLTHWSSLFVRSLHYHAIFLLTIISLLYTASDLPFSMTYFHLGQHPYRSIPFCLWWYWWDYSLLVISLFLTANASIQRHILTFHFVWLHSKWQRILLHYFPLLFSLAYPPIFYIVFMFFYPCEVYFNVDDGWCAYPCYVDQTLLYNIDWLVNTILPVFIIVIANLGLVIRVCRSMKRMRLEHARAWQRQKKLTLQLFVFSSLYVIVWFPTTVLSILRALVFPNLFAEHPDLYYIYYLIYFVSPLQSFLCVFAVPEMIDWIQTKARRCFRRSSVVPVIPIR